MRRARHRHLRARRGPGGRAQRRAGACPRHQRLLVTPLLPPFCGVPLLGADTHRNICRLSCPYCRWVPEGVRQLVLSVPPRAAIFGGHCGPVCYQPADAQTSAAFPDRASCAPAEGPVPGAPAGGGGRGAGARRRRRRRARQPHAPAGLPLPGRLHHRQVRALPSLSPSLR